MHEISAEQKMSYEIHVGPNIRKSPYFAATVKAGVRSFSVYNHMYIPGNFGDAQAEYERLINGVAMWDVAAQRQVELRGPDAAVLAEFLSTRDVAQMRSSQGRYVLMCNRDGMVINDPVLLPLAEDRYWFSIADSDIALWAAAFAEARELDVIVSEPDVSPLAIQGPHSSNVARELFGDWVLDLPYFAFRETTLDNIPLVVARSGWSKQGGYELYLMDGSRGVELWNLVHEAGQPHGIGPGAPNDVERIESGLISYGADIRCQTEPATPYELGLGRLVDLERKRDFVGRAVLERISQDVPARHRCGVYIEGPPVAPNEHPLTVMRKGRPVGTLSEMVYSPRLERNIGLAFISTTVAPDVQDLSILHDGKPRFIAQTDLPFISPVGTR